MKKLQLSLIAVAIIAVGSAFASPREMDPSDIYVETSPGNFELKSTVQGQGDCQELANRHCEYQKNGSTYTPLDNDRAWVPY